MILNVAVGQQGTLAPGGPSMRGSYDGSLVRMAGHSRYQEAVYRGNVWSAGQVAATTMPTVAASGWNAPTTTTLFNPAGSGVNGVIWYAAVTNLVAFAAAALIGIAINFGGAATTGTVGLATNQLTGQQSAGKIKPFTTATLPAAPTNLVAILGAQLTGAITTAPQVPSLGGWFDGAIILAPGNALSFVATTVSGAGAFGFWIYEEVPVNMG